MIANIRFPASWPLTRRGRRRMGYVELNCFILLPSENLFFSTMRLVAEGLEGGWRKIESGHLPIRRHKRNQEKSRLEGTKYRDYQIRCCFATYCKLKHKVLVWIYPCCFFLVWTCPDLIYLMCHGQIFVSSNPLSQKTFPRPYPLS